LLQWTPSYGFGIDGNEQLDVPPNASNLEYEVELTSFAAKNKGTWSMDAVEKLEQA
jgi:hypothetical protein